MRDTIEFEWFNGPDEDIMTKVEFRVPEWEDDPFEDLKVWVKVDGEYRPYEIDEEEARELDQIIFERWEPDLPEPEPELTYYYTDPVDGREYGTL